ncbi:MAG: LPS export ABC transporter ATP-binding protein [Isosphaeraceae bacterium]
MALLEVRGLEKWYGRRQVVNGVDFDINRGEVVGLLGPNGAGKTTSFRMTIGLIDADGGSVVFDGRDVTRLPMYLRARAGMGYLAQDSSVFKQLTVEDNLMAIIETRPGLNRKQRRERQDELLRQFGLEKIRKTKANRVSGGERRRLEIARSLVTEPKLIMLDEPFAGIDPKTVAEIQDQIRSLVETYHIGILLTDHQFRETIEVCDRTYVIREGRVFAYGNREQIVNNPEVRRHYIGERFDVGQLLTKHHAHALTDSQAPHTPTPAAALTGVEAATAPAASTAEAAAPKLTPPTVQATPALEVPAEPEAEGPVVQAPAPREEPKTRAVLPDLDAILASSVTIVSNEILVPQEEAQDEEEFPDLGIDVQYNPAAFWDDDQGPLD